MICLGCGKETGSMLTYCETCSHLNPKKTKKGSEEIVVEVSKEEINQSNNNSAGIIEEDDNTKRSLRIFILLSIVAFFITLSFYLFLFRSNSKKVETIKKIPSVSYLLSSIAIDGASQELLSSIAKFDSKNLILEIAYFNSVLKNLNEESLKSLESLIDIANLKPEVVLHLQLKNMDTCNISNIASSRVMFLMPGEENNYLEKPIIFNSGINKNIATAFGTLDCSLKKEGHLKGQFKILISLKAKDGSQKNLSFDLKNEHNLIYK